MKLKDRVVLDPEILAGKPIIRGTRISAQFLLEPLANGWTYERILNNYPQLFKEDIQAALEYAAETLKADLTQEKC